jgi:RNA recognition motif. (a.k.a. RRM, RBD, or RNP domain)
VGQLGRKSDLDKDHRSPEDDTGSHRSLDSSIATNDLDFDHRSGAEQGFRLDEINDELHSDLYSNSLTSLRNQIVTCLPQTEEMVSRAIIKAFFVDSQSIDHSCTFRSLEEMDCNRIEADYIFEARCWLRLNVNVAPRPDVEHLSLQFIQRCIDNIFLRIRNEELNSDEAARIVLSVAAVLGLKFAVAIARDAIMLDGLASGTSEEDLRKYLSRFGEVDALSMSSRSPTFGFCRFVFEESTCQVMSAYEDGNIVVNGRKPTICPLIVFNKDASKTKSNECDDKADNDDDPGMVSATNSSKFPINCKKILPVDFNCSPNTVVHERLGSYNLSDHRCESEIRQQRYNSSSAAAACC